MTAPLPPLLVLLAGGLLVALLWRRTAPRLRSLGLVALAVYATEQVHLSAQRSSWERGSVELLDRKLAAVESRKEGLVRALQGATRRVAALPEARAALAGEEPTALFAALEAQARSVPGISLALHDPSLATVAWTGRIAELQRFKGLIPPEGGVFALEGTLTTTWIAAAPVRDTAGAIHGVATAELAASVRRHLRNEFLSDFDLLSAQDPDIEINAIDLRDPGEEAHPFPALPRGTVSRQSMLRGPSGFALAAVRITAPQLEHAARELRARYRRVLAVIACAGVVLWTSARRRAGWALALGATLFRMACLVIGPGVPPRWGVLSSDAYASPFLGSLAGDALRALRFSAAGYWAEALMSPLLRSPLDLFLTSAWILTLAGVVLAHALRLPPTPSRGWRAIVGSLLALPVIAGTFAWISDTVNNSPLDLVAVGLWPRSPAHLLVEVSLLAILAAGLALLAAILARSCPMPVTRRGAAALIGLWLALGLVAERFWPRELIGLPLVSALGLFAAGVLVGTAADHWRSALARRTLEARAALCLAGVAMLGGLLYPAVAHYSEKNVRQQIEHEHAPLVRRQPQWRDYMLAAARREVDRMRLFKGALPGPHPPGIEELAYAVWASTDLASAGLSSAVELQDTAGATLSRFAFNLPTLGGAAIPLPPSESWSEAWQTLPVGSAGRRVLHASRRIVEAGALRGAVHLYVGDDYANLPFLSGKDPYATLYRSAPRGAYRDRPVDLLVYGSERQVLFSSADRPPALDAGLAARAARPNGVWATIPVDGRPQHTYLFREGERSFGLCYPRIGALRFCADLVEAVSSLTLLGLVALLLVVAVRTLLRRPGLSLSALYDAVERRFAVRVFAAFVVLAVLPMGVLQAIVGKFVRDRFWKESDDQALELAGARARRSRTSRSSSRASRRASGPSPTPPWCGSRA
jgi:hypothetical protein